MQVMKGLKVESDTLSGFIFACTTWSVDVHQKAFLWPFLGKSVETLLMDWDVWKIVMNCFILSSVIASELAWN